MAGNSGNHRTPGAKTVLPQGVRKAIEACLLADENDPLRKEAEGIILQIMRGELTGRHIQTRLSAAVLALERARGKPTQPVHVRDERPREVRFPGQDSAYVPASGQLDSPDPAALPAGRNGESGR